MVIQPAVTDAQISELLPACQRGDKDAVEGLYGLYADRLYRYMLARTGDPDTAADLAGEAFVRVMQHLPDFRPNPDCPAAAFSGWLYRIAANLVADHRRQPGRIVGSLDDENVVGGPDPQRLAERCETLARLTAAMEQLTEEQRLVLLGKFGEELSNLEIAAWLGKTEGAVKSLQHRALRMLAQMLRRERQA